MAENACRLSVEAMLQEMMECGYFMRYDWFNQDDLKPGETRWSLFRTKPTDLHGRVVVLVGTDYVNIVERAYDAFNDDTTIK